MPYFQDGGHDVNSLYKVLPPGSKQEASANAYAAATVRQFLICSTFVLV